MSIGIGVNLALKSDRVNDWYHRISRIAPSNLIGLWLLDDENTTVRNSSTLGNALNGVSTNCLLRQSGAPVSGYATYFDGTAYLDLYSTGLQNAFNADEYTMLIWAKVSASGDWSDGAYRRLFKLAVSGGSTITEILKSNSANQVIAGETAGGVNKSVVGVQNSTGWICYVVTCSRSGDAYRFYQSGTQTGTDQTGLGVWGTGVLADNYCALGGALGHAASSPWKGTLGPAALWSTELTPGEVVSASRPFDTILVGTLRLLYVGDSKTATGWQWMLQDLLQDRLDQFCVEDPARIGIGGITSSGMATRVNSDIAAMISTPHEVLINLGANDLQLGVGDGSTFKTSMDTIVSAYHTAFPNANIRLAKVYRNDTDYTAQIAVLSAKVDELYASYSWLQPGINEGSFLPGNLTDGVHPTPSGYMMEAQAWLSVICP